MLELVMVYLVAGVLAVLGAVSCHLAIAEKKGHNAIDYWVWCYKTALKTNGLAWFFVGSIAGMIVWPLEIVSILLVRKTLYRAYDLFKDMDK